MAYLDVDNLPSRCFLPVESVARLREMDQFPLSSQANSQKVLLGPPFQDNLAPQLEFRSQNQSVGPFEIALARNLIAKP